MHALGIGPDWIARQLGLSLDDILLVIESVSTRMTIPGDDIARYRDDWPDYWSDSLIVDSADLVPALDRLFEELDALNRFFTEDRRRTCALSSATTTVGMSSPARGAP